ncbi:MAG: class I SAM-dependent methyltransferase [Chloroflexi bacterium HGW-Chloroflexi-3]|nr:MAG: class I SAM-dependent methyltransferase [Chloroflexi bacterium HGW-Chloroflexi-3]
MNEKLLQKQDQFAFGENWQRFLSVLTNDHLLEAEKSLKCFLETIELSNLKFLDIGSGSGIHSLAARRLGANVLSFDFDLKSVACTEELKRRFSIDDPYWQIDQGSILDKKYIEGLGKFDICYAWGVLHHTGSLWQALYNAQIPLIKGGYLFIAIYNDQEIVSALWKVIKRNYNKNRFMKSIITIIFFSLFFFSGFFSDIVHLRNPINRYRDHKKYRGMSLIHDWRDWLGGYPYEPARPQEIIDFYVNLGFRLMKFTPTGHGFGNNQFLFQKEAE